MNKLFIKKFKVIQKSIRGFLKDNAIKTNIFKLYKVFVEFCEDDTYKDFTEDELIQEFINVITLQKPYNCKEQPQIMTIKNQDIYIVINKEQLEVNENKINCNQTPTYYGCYFTDEQILQCTNETEIRKFLALKHAFKENIGAIMQFYVEAKTFEVSHIGSQIDLEKGIYYPNTDNIQYYTKEKNDLRFVKFIK